MFDDDGVLIATAQTDAEENFEFTGVPPASGYTVFQINNTDFVDVDDTDGTENGTDLTTILVDASCGDVIGLEFVGEVGSEAPSLCALRQRSVIRCHPWFHFWKCLYRHRRRFS